MPWRSPDAPAWPPVRNPFEVGAGVFYVVVGTVGLLGTVSPTMAQTLSGAVLILWLVGAGVSGGALVFAAAMAKRDWMTSLLLERVGLLGVFGFSSYLLVLFISGGAQRSPVGIALTVMYVVASAWRLREVSKSLRWVRNAEKVVVQSPIILMREEDPGE